MRKKYTLGVGLNLFDARAVLLEEKNKIVAQIDRRRKNTTANDAIQVILELCEGIISKAGRFKDRISSIGLALGGIVDKKKGTVYWPQRIDSNYVYISIPLKKYLEDKFKLPVVIENDANACVWAEYLCNFPKNNNIIYLFSGVGCGLLINGSVLRGKNGAAGEVFINQSKVMTSYLGDFSFLKPWPLDLGVVKRVKELIALGKNTSLIKNISPTGTLKIEDVFRAARNKDKLSKDVLKEAAFSLGIKLSLLINLFNPEIVIVGGGFEEAGNLFLDELNRAVKEFSFSEMRGNLKIVLSKLGRSATSLGAALIAVEEKPLHQ